MKPIVAIVGRPNVGKSTLFNRLVGEQLAIVHDAPGVTRDRHYAGADLGGREILLVDTGGFDPTSEDPMGQGIARQVKVAIEEADVIICVLDGSMPPTQPDADSVLLLRRSGKPVVYIANKIDNRARLADMADHYSLGVEDLLAVSALHGLGTGELARSVVEKLPPPEERELLDDPEADALDEEFDDDEPEAADDDDEDDEDRAPPRVLVYELGQGVDPSIYDDEDEPSDDENNGENDDDAEPATDGAVEPAAAPADADVEVPPAPPAVPPRVALLGRPNAGKSSLFNQLVGTERSLVDSVPGTTRDPVDSLIEHPEGSFLLIDTAGVRRKSKVERGVEAVSVMRTLRTMERAEVVVLVNDATEGISDQDARLLGLAAEQGRAILVALNKMDLLSPAERKAAEENARDALHFATWLTIVPMSALTGHGVPRLVRHIIGAATEFRRRIPTGQLNRFFEGVLAHHTPPTHNGRAPRIYYLTQAETSPPLFIAMASNPEHIADSYKRFVQNQIRKAFKFHYSPVRIRYRKRTQRDDKPRPNKPFVKRS